MATYSGSRRGRTAHPCSTHWTCIAWSSSSPLEWRDGVSSRRIRPSRGGFPRLSRIYTGFYIALVRKCLSHSVNSPGKQSRHITAKDGRSLRTFGQTNTGSSPCGSLSNCRYAAQDSESGPVVTITGFYMALMFSREPSVSLKRPYRSVGACYNDSILALC